MTFHILKDALKLHNSSAAQLLAALLVSCHEVE